MRIGILSDTHGSVARLASAVELLVDRGAEALVHCGDVDSLDCVAMLGEARVPAFLTAGNVDRYLTDLESFAASAGVVFDWRSVEVEIAPAERLVATHGNDHDLLDGLINGGRFRYVCHGHTHRVRDERRGAVRVINPGAVYRPRRPNYPTAALLETVTDELEFLPLQR